MFKDPIVEEARKAGEEIVKRAGGDIHSLCEYLRKQEKRHGSRLVHREPVKR